MLFPELKPGETGIAGELVPESASELAFLGARISSVPLAYTNFTSLFRGSSAALRRSFCKDPFGVTGCSIEVGRLVGGEMLLCFAFEGTSSGAVPMELRELEGSLSVEGRTRTRGPAAGCDWISEAWKNIGDSLPASPPRRLLLRPPAAEVGRTEATESGREDSEPATMVPERRERADGERATATLGWRDFGADEIVEAAELLRPEELVEFLTRGVTGVAGFGGAMVEKPGGLLERVLDMRSAAGVELRARGGAFMAST